MHKAENEMSVALKVLARRRVSVEEMRRILAGKGFSNESVSQCLEKLISWGYLDDKSLARDIIAQAMEEYPIGLTKAMWDLEKRLIPAEVAADIAREIFRDQDEESLAKVAALRYLSDRKCQSPADVRRLARWLSRRGFGTEAVQSVVSSFLDEIDTE